MDGVNLNNNFTMCDGLKLTYQHSIIMPCYCQSIRMLEENKEIAKLKINNNNNIICGEIIETRHEIDNLGRKHEKRINHCQKCSDFLKNKI